MVWRDVIGGIGWVDIPPRYGGVFTMGRVG